jgi:hypothetical protein
MISVALVISVALDVTPWRLERSWKIFFGLQFTTSKTVPATLFIVISAHACSEIGLKWFLFAIHDLGAVLEFISVLDFFGYLSLSNPAETCKREF